MTTPTDATNADEIARAKQRLSKTVYYRLTDPVEKNPGAVEFWVVFLDKGKAKCGRMKDPFYVRYGIDVAATFAGGERWWFRSPGEIPEGASARMRALFDGQADALGPVVDLDALAWHS